MKYIKDNKELLIKYLLVLISNIILFILCNFYFSNSKYMTLTLLFIIIILDMIIYYYRGNKTYKWYLDIICNIVVGIILMLFIKDRLEYSNILLSIFLANNIIFMRSRYSDKIYKICIQYLMIFGYTIICMFINILLFIIFK